MFLPSGEGDRRGTKRRKRYGFDAKCKSDVSGSVRNEKHGGNEEKGSEISSVTTACPFGEAGKTLTAICFHATQVVPGTMNVFGSGLD